MPPPDNVTPFRPRKTPPRAPSGQGMGLTTHRGKAILVQALSVVTFVLLFFVTLRPWSYLVIALGVAAVAVAFTNRQDAMPWAKTHHEHALRTILIGYAIWALSEVILGLFGPLSFVILFIHIAVLLWVAVRGIVGFVLAVIRKPIGNPKGVLF